MAHVGRRFRPEVSSTMKTVNLIFIGDGFYLKSRTDMSSLYEEKTWVRYDWGFVSRDLANGVAINIRPATDEELGRAYRMLKEIK